MNLRTFTHETQWIEAIVNDMTFAIKNSDTPSLLLPGGSTPRPIYKMLGKADLPWEQIHIFQTDERLVPEDHAMSNQTMIKNTLGEAILRKSIFHPLPTANSPIELIEVSSRLPRGNFTLAILGMGTDGHIASLFPNDATITKRKEPIYFVERPPHEYHRVTLSLDRLMRADHMILIIRGQEKLDLLQSPELAEPLKTILEHPHLTVYSLIES